jgi:hypothetical protein
MENFTEEAVKSLAKLSEINTARMEGYGNAISKVCKGDMKTYFGEKVKETLDLTNQINRFIGQSNTGVNEVENKKIQRSNFYFTIAKASDNPRTVILSCQLGDECAVTAYKDILLSKTVKLLPYLREILQKQLSNLEDCLMATHQILFDTTFA